MSLYVTTAPTVEPVTTAEAKTHLRVTASADDDYIAGLVAAARFEAEKSTARDFVERTRVLKLRSWPAQRIYLPQPPLQSITSITYVDNAGDTQTWAAENYTVSAPGADGLTEAPPHGFIEPAYSVVWPTIRIQWDAITITYVSGYADSGASPVVQADRVPEAAKQAIKFLVGTWYQSRETVIAGTTASKVPDTFELLLSGLIVDRIDLRYG